MLPRTLRAMRLAAVAALVALAAGACRADVAVDIAVAEDGSGVVRAEVVLDAEATEGLRDLGLEATLPLSDLAQAGWEVDRPDVSPSGETTIGASKAFGDAAQLTEVMEDLTGADGVFQDFRLVRLQSFGRVDYTLDGVIDPTGGFDAFGDDELDTALGRSLSAIAVSYEASEEDVAFTLTASLPGEFQEEGSTGSISTIETGAEGRWSTDLAGNRVDVALQTARRSTAAQVLRGVAVVAAVLAALVLFAQILRVFGARRRQLQEERARATRQAARRAAASGSTSAGAATVAGSPSTGSSSSSESADGDGSDAATVDDDGAERFRVVALDGPGVLYKEGDDIRQLLVPFARERGSTATADDVADKARLLSLGRLTPADFWKAIGVDGDPNELDSAYLATHQLSSGVVRYLRGLRSREVRAACVTNDSAAWAMKLRSSHSLDGLIDPWVVSGSVGVRKPDAPLFEVLRRVTGEAPSAILVIDDDLDNLDAARDLGFATRWFTRDGERDEARGHEIMRGFDAFAPTDTGEISGPEERSSDE